MADITDAGDTDKENDDDEDLPELQAASDDEDDEAEEAYQRTKALGDADRDVICFFIINSYFVTNQIVGTEKLEQR